MATPTRLDAPRCAETLSPAVAFSPSCHHGAHLCSPFLKDRSPAGGSSNPSSNCTRHSPSPRDGYGEKTAPRDLPTTSWRAGFPPASLRLLHQRTCRAQRSPSRPWPPGTDPIAAHQHVPSQHLQPFPPATQIPKRDVGSAAFWQSGKGFSVLIYVN